MQEEASKTLKSLKDFCRICGTFQTFNRLHLFHIMPPQLRLKVFKILPYNISIDDKLPKYCCYKCIDKLKEFISFVDKSWTIQKMFHRKVCIEEQDPSKFMEINIPLPNTWYGPETPDVASPSIKSTDSKEARDPSPKQMDEVVISSGESDHLESLSRRLKREKCKEEVVDDKFIDVVGISHAGSDNDTVSNKSWQGSTQSSQGGADKHQKKLRNKFKRQNPFCTTRRYKRGRGRNKGGPMSKRKKSEPADSQSKQSSLCQLYIDGEVKMVPRPAGLKSDAFILCTLPRPGRDLIYYCTLCDVICTSKTAASHHICKQTRASSELSGHSDSAVSVSPAAPAGAYTCQICGATFPRRVALEHHVTSHVQSDVSDEEIAPPRGRRRRRRDTSESSVELSDLDSSEVVDSDNFVVADDVDDFIVSDGESRRKKKKRRARTRSKNRRTQFIFD